MAVTVRGTDILFNDGTTQSTAAVAPTTRSWQTQTMTNNVNLTNTFGKEIVVAAMCNGTGGYGFTDQCW